jgi:hypothetical protein
MQNSSLKAIEVREREIADQIAPLQKELDDLAIAKRVLLSLERPSDRSVQEVIVDSGKAGKPRPSGAPTNFEMTERVLADAERNGKDGLVIGEIVDAIRSRYWPGLVSEQITPSIYGFATNGRLKKSVNGKFKRVKKPEGSADSSAEPS